VRLGTQLRDWQRIPGDHHGEHVSAAPQQDQRHVVPPASAWWRRLGHAPLWKQPSGDSILDPFAGLLTRKWEEGRNAAQLWRKLVLRGFHGRNADRRGWVPEWLAMNQLSPHSAVAAAC